MADNTLPKVAETALPVAAMENVTHLRVVSTDNSEKLPKNDLTIAGTKVTVAVDGLSGTVDGAFGDVLTAIAGKADTTQVEALADVDKANYAKSVEMIAHDATAPSPVIPTGTTKTYEFSSGGECAWITSGAVAVEVGDKVSAAFTEPSTWVYTYHNVLKRKASGEDLDNAVDRIGELETLQQTEHVYQNPDWNTLFTRNGYFVFADDVTGENRPEGLPVPSDQEVIYYNVVSAGKNDVAGHNNPTLILQRHGTLEVYFVSKAEDNLVTAIRLVDSAELSTVVGDINTILDNLNGEVI